ncbi:putative K domain-containing protein [Lupinus albus]|uniref:Putative K domain-containing protein n=1 Tax=Lupinus albus TaxID=3870 RepID=A0A6A4Q3Y8_LUPAL|nr:putative K domain-containing protein [Lupinus albus]
MMERSRSKRNYYYNQDYDSETLARTRPRYNYHYSNRYRDAYGGAGGRHLKLDHDAPVTVTTSYRILCNELRTGGVIEKFGGVIKSIRQHTGAWINVHELVPGDEERIIEISDTRRRDADGRMPMFSPAQEALLLINEKILESDVEYRVAAEEEYGGGGRNWDRVAARLVVSRMHVGCLLGKGGKIIEQMRMETKTQIRVLPRDHNLPRCVSISEETVQVSGDVNAVKNAVKVISSRLRESQHRDRSHFHGHGHSQEHFLSPDDNYNPHGGPLRLSVEAAAFGSQGSATNARNNNHPSLGAYVANDAQPFYGEDLVFRIVCPVEKVDHIIGESYRFVEFLQNDVGVDIKVTDPIGGSEERIIIITSEEGPDDELFPAQEALLHIQTRIVDLVLDKGNTITTRLVVPSSDIECLDGKYASLSEIKRLTGANIQILPKEERPLCVAKTDELIQIVGEIKAARDAVVEVTSRLRSYLYRDFIQRDTVPPSASLSRMEASSSNTTAPATETSTIYQNSQTVATAVLPSKMETGGSSAEAGNQKDNQLRDNVPIGLNRITVPPVTRSILEVVLPEYAVPRLIARSKSKLAQISELSGANVTLVEDRPDVTEKIIQLSGTPEQTERAQSLLQGFILSTQEDDP